MLQQLLRGFAREAEGAVLGAREAGAPRGRRQLLEVRFLDRVATGVHSCRGISTGGKEHNVPRCLSRSRTTETTRGAQMWPSTPGAVGAAVTARGST